MSSSFLFFLKNMFALIVTLKNCLYYINSAIFHSLYGCSDDSGRHCCGTNMLWELTLTLIYFCSAKHPNLFKAIWGQRTISKGGFRESSVAVTATDWTWIPLLCHYRAKWEGTDKACCVRLSSSLPRLLLRRGESPWRTAAGQLA